MAVYKVPQDVEAEDKLLGPFSFRQFIYLIIVAMLIALAWGLSMLFVGLAVIPIPFILIFALLALPLRKDQPMETYLAAMIQYFLKPHRRLWMADGIVSRITIDAPKQVEGIQLKSISSEDANSQFNYLAQVADTRGWSTRGVTDPTGTITNSSYDILDDTSAVTQSFSGMLEQQDAQRKDQLMQKMSSGSFTRDTFAASVPPAVPPTQVSPRLTVEQTIFAPTYPTVQSVIEEPKISYNPYPVSIQQRTISPIQEHNTQPIVAAENMTAQPIVASAPAPSPAIINLAQDDSGLSIETIAKEAHRIEDLRADNDEVIISLH